MKIIFFVLVLVGLGMYFYKKEPVVERTGIPAYNEIRLELTSGSRTVELVSYVKRDSSESCEVVRVWWVESMMKCFADQNCKVIKNQCVEDVSRQYKNMFNEKQVDTTYLKAVNPVLARESITLFWGLTMEESVMLCNKMSQHLKRLAQIDPNIQYRCI